MSRYGWSERNAGNISVLLPEAEFETPREILRKFQLPFSPPELLGRVILVTGTGKYFRNIAQNPAENLGVLRVGKGELELLWGHENGGAPTSEISSHLRSHAARLRADPLHSVVCHTHPTALIAMSAVHDLSEREFSRTLWSSAGECLMFLPEGLGVLPWLPCGCDEIGLATAEKMKNYRLVIWANHGIFAAGKSLDDALGLIEIAEKAADIYLKIANFPDKRLITAAQLRQLAETCKITVKEGWLND
jgi:rhamnulose-1-phosphate aldolase